MGVEVQLEGQQEAQATRQLTDREQRKLLWKEWYPIPLSGFGIALLISLFALSGSKGGEEAMEQLIHHALEIHPLFWALCFTAVPLYVALLGWKLRPLLKAILVPIVDFVTHIFGLAVGAFLVIAPYYYFEHHGLGCQDLTIGISLFLYLFAFSTIGKAGLLYIEHEKVVKEPKNWVLVVCLILTLVGIYVTYKAAGASLETV
jgi:hypothetical protein